MRGLRVRDRNCGNDIALESRAYHAEMPRIGLEFIVLAPTRPALPHNHPVAMLWGIRLQGLQIARLGTAQAQNALHNRPRIDEPRPFHYANVQIVPGAPTAALLNFTENDSPSAKVSGEA